MGEPPAVVDGGRTTCSPLPAAQVVRFLLLVALCIFTAPVVGCGDERTEDEPIRVLEETFDQDQALRSGILEVSFELEISAAELSQAQTVSIEGPFTLEGGQAPRFHLDLDVSPETGGAAVEASAIAAGDAGYLEYEGRAYEIAPEVFRRWRGLLSAGGIDPAGWFVEPSVEGGDDLGRTETVRISGAADIARLSADLRALADQAGLRPAGLSAGPELFDEATVDVLISAEDHTLRRLQLRLRWEGRLEGGEPFDGMIDISLAIEAPNQPQRIIAPETSTPLREAVERLPNELTGLGEFLAGRPG